MPRYAPSGHLVFLRAERLFALPFDASRRLATGEPVALNDRASADPSSGVVYAAIAADGTFAFVPAAGPAAERSIVLTDRTGKARNLPVPARGTTIPASRRTENASRSRSAPATAIPTTSGP